MKDIRSDRTSNRYLHSNNDQRPTESKPMTYDADNPEVIEQDRQ